MSDKRVENNSEKPQSWLRRSFNKLRSLLGLRPSSLKESLEEVIEEHDAAGENIDVSEKDMLRNVLTFSELSVEDVMIPRADIVYVSHSITLEELKKIVSKKAHTRMPVCGKTLDDILGFIHIKDLVSVLSNGKEFNIDDVLRQVIFVPPSMQISDLMVKMRLSRVHMALVVDEYGGTEGLVTMEDLMEEIVGEIEDEHDIEEEVIFKKLGTNHFDSSARISIEELEEKLDVEFGNGEKPEDFDTLGGLIFSILGRVPAVGELALYKLDDNSVELEFEVTEADPRRVKRAIIRKKDITS